MINHPKDAKDFFEAHQNLPKVQSHLELELKNPQISRIS